MSGGKPAIRVEGAGGYFAGLAVEVPPMGAVSAGRSRSCQLSARASASFRGAADRNALLRDDAFNRLSRVHCEITDLGGHKVEVRDLSRNGTWVNGERVRGSVVLDIAAGEGALVAPVEGSLGAFRVRRA